MQDAVQRLLARHHSEVVVGGDGARAVALALAAVRAVAKEHGFTVEELLGAKPVIRTTAKGVAKYANPDDPSQTWSGRGRQPAWVKAALATGKPMASLAI